MAHRMKNTSTNKSDRVLSWSIVILSILGAIDALYLLIYKLTGNNQMCLGNGGCHNVNFSPYSEIYGIPVSALGLAAYLVIAGIILLEPRLHLGGRKWSINGLWNKPDWRCFHSLSHLSGVLCYSLSLSILCGFGNYHYLDFHSSHYQAN